MALSDDPPDYEDDDQSLNMFLALLIRRLDVVAKRHLVALFLDRMGTTEKQNPLDTSKTYLRVQLSEESLHRAKLFLENVEAIFFDILPPKQEELYQYCINMRASLDSDSTPSGYIDFLNICHHLVKMTGLPFSLEEDYGGLKTWDAWNTAIDQAMAQCKIKFAIGK